LQNWILDPEDFRDPGFHVLAHFSIQKKDLTTKARRHKAQTPDLPVPGVLVVKKLFALSFR
jgi:hypothetical protein